MQVINTNVAALFAGSALNKSANALQTAQQRLSSGLRINSSKDDATGLSIAAGYDTQIRDTNIAVRTANDGISAAQTADGLLAQVQENLTRMSEISVQTAGAGSKESAALLAENTRILALAGAKVGTGGVQAKIVNDGVGGQYTSTYTAPPTLAATATDTVANYQKDITAVTDARAQLGADMVALGSAVTTMQTSSVNLSAAYSRIMDTDYAAETTSMTRNNILQQAGTAALAQANQTPSTVLTLLR